MRRRLIVPVLGLILLAPAGCGGNSADSPGSGSAADSDAVSAARSATAGGGNDVVPPCPLTAAQVTEIVGRELEDVGNCSFSNGTTGVSIVTYSESGGKANFDGQREYAKQEYRQVKDLDKGDMAYLAVKDAGALAFVVTKSGGYTVLLETAIGFDAAKFEQTMRKLLDTIVK